MIAIPLFICFFMCLNMHTFFSLFKANPIKNINTKEKENILIYQLATIKSQILPPSINLSCQLNIADGNLSLSRTSYIQKNLRFCCCLHSFSSSYSSYFSSSSSFFLFFCFLSLSEVYVAKE